VGVFLSWARRRPGDNPKKVAVKRTKAVNASELKSFEQEARQINAIRSHPNVIRLLGICMEEGFSSMVTDLYNGGDLMGARHYESFGVHFHSFSFSFSSFSSFLLFLSFNVSVCFLNLFAVHNKSVALTYVMKGWLHSHASGRVGATHLRHEGLVALTYVMQGWLR
jgi:serine/threonine protein kinase